MASKDSSVINVPPIFRCCKEIAFDICCKDKHQPNKKIALSEKYYSWYKFVQFAQNEVNS